MPLSGRCRSSIICFEALTPSPRVQTSFADLEADGGVLLRDLKRLIAKIRSLGGACAVAADRLLQSNAPSDTVESSGFTDYSWAPHQGLYQVRVAGS